MAELLFIATIVFVAYVVFVVLGEKKDSSEPAKTEAAKPEPVEPQVQQPEKAAPPPVAVKAAAKPARAKAAAKPAAAAKAAPAKAAPAAAPVQAPTPVSDSLKNPKTGEVAKVPNSYAFAKRWIKDALVEEGLLEKVYKNNELDDATTAKIQNALQQLKAMAKYQ